MIKKHQTQAGSAHIILITLLVIALIGTLGYIFWQNYTSRTTQKASTSQAENPAVKPQTQSTIASNERYVTLDDWGVKFKLDDGIEDAGVVQYKRYDQASPPQEYYILNTASADKAWKAECPDVSSPVGDMIYRFTDKPSVDANGQLLEADGTLLNASAIDGHYYVFVKQGYVACASGSKTSQPVSDVATTSELLLTSLRTLQSVK